MAKTERRIYELLPMTELNKHHLVALTQPAVSPQISGSTNRCNTRRIVLFGARAKSITKWWNVVFYVPRF